MNTPLDRRQHLKQLGATAVGLACSRIATAESEPSKLILGLDAHSVRAMKWKAPQLIDYAAEQSVQAVLLNSLNYFDDLSDDALKKIREQAEAKGIQIRIGAGGVSEGAASFKPKFGTPEEAMLEGIRVALALGSPTVNCRIGNIDDRVTPGGIKARIAEAVAVLKAIKPKALDAGLKFAFENHAGDTRSEEILALIEAVGSDFCGAMMDPGNALWAMEDPMEQLEKLGPHVLCTSIRDYTVWASEGGATFQWTALGDGLMNVPAYAQRFKELCPEVPFFVETISNQARPLPFLTEAFMEGFPDLKAKDITSFLKLVRQGAPPPIHEAPEGSDPKLFEQKIQKVEFEKSISLLCKMR